MSIASIDLPGYDLWMTFIKNVHVVPAPLDIPRFQSSLQIALQRYPHATGRLKKEDSRWSILPTQSTVAIEVTRLEALDAGFRDDRVIQDNLKQYLHSQQGAASSANDDGPLLLFKLTVAREQTAIGVSWHHTHGDATTLLRFMQTLSHAYQGLPLPSPPPTFAKHTFPEPTQETIEQYAPLMPHLARTYHQSELAARYAGMNQDVMRVDFRVSAAALRRLADAVREKTGEPTVSRQDCLTAYVVTVLNRCGAGPIEAVTNAASYRNVAAPFVDSEVAGNPIYIMRAEFEGIEKLSSTALAIRRSIERWRELSFITAYMSVASQLMLDAANAGRSMFFAAEPGVLSVNSNLSLDWQSVDFGYPDGANFHTSGVNE